MVGAILAYASARAAPRSGKHEQTVRLYYVVVAGNGLQTIDVREELEKIAAFETQTTTVRKTIARLQLLATPGTVLQFKADDFEFTEEPLSSGGDEMNDGCGFISDELLQRLNVKSRSTTCAVASSGACSTSF